MTRLRNKNDTTMQRFVFVVHNNVQVNNAKSVIEFLPYGEAFYFETSSLKLSTEPPLVQSHLPRSNPVDLVAQMFSRLLNENDILIVPQDLGLVFRIIISNARRRGARIVLMPDGIASSRPVSNLSGIKLHLSKAVNGVLALLGLASKTNGIFGGSKPDVLLRWGSGWADSFEVSGATKFVDAGCPRADELSNLPKLPSEQKLLVCSQPLSIPAWSRPYVENWYGFLVDLTNLSSTNFDLRIRLHPAEDPADLPEEVRGCLSTDRPVVEDIAWASTVAAPFSTVLVEAAAAGRTPIQLSFNEDMNAISSGYPFFKSSLVIQCDWNANNLSRTVAELDKQIDLSKLDHYLTNRGNASQTVAQLLVSIRQGAHELHS